MVVVNYINSGQRSPVQALCIFVNLYAWANVVDINNCNWWWNSSTTFVVFDKQRRHSGLWNSCTSHTLLRHVWAF